jgi:hypothetical protein
LLYGSPLIKRIARALMVAPVPAWLHRTVVERTVLGGVQLEAGDRVAIHLGSAASDRSGKGPDADLLFGGRYSADKGTGSEQTPWHSCPAKEFGLGVLIGMLVAVLEQKSIRAEGPLALSFDGQPTPTGN